MTANTALLALLKELDKKHIDLWTEQGKLKFHAPKGAMTTDLRDQLRAHKQALIDTLANLDASDVSEPIPAAPRDRPLPLSYEQQRLWVVYQIMPESPAYNIIAPLGLRGFLDPLALDRALCRCVTRHESLRTRFGERENQPVQIVEPPPDRVLEVVDFRGLTPAEDRERLAGNCAEGFGDRPFNLGQGPLFRARLVQFEDRRWGLMLAMHHIISDGWSQNILLGELFAFYRAELTGAAYSPPELPIQYGDFAAWQRNHVTPDRLKADLDFWRRELAEPRAVLPTERPRPPLQAHEGAVELIEIPETLMERVKALSISENATLFMALLTAYSIILWSYSGQTDILAGVAVSGRDRPETQSLIGFFVNTLTMRTRIDPFLTFRDALERVRQTANAAYAHQAAPFEVVVEALQPERNLSRNLIFQTMFTFQAMEKGKGEGLDLPGVEFEEMETGFNRTMFDLALSLEEWPDGLFGGLNYNVALFRQDTIRDMARALQRTLALMAENPDQPIETAHWRTDEERRRLYFEEEASASSKDGLAARRTVRTAQGTVPIGAPFANSRTYVVDGQLRPAPLGVAGELCIGGAGLARGYLGQPDLTAVKFSPDPFSAKPGQRLYRTGDLAINPPNGQLEFIGRADFQIKIRGFRIELGEIEDALAAHPLVHKAVARAVMDESAPSGGKRLIGYLQVAADRIDDARLKDDVRALTQNRLPDYMRPDALVMLDAFPLSANGKIDLKALPIPERTRAEADAAFHAPRTETEYQIARIWSELLGIDRIGTQDNFFQLGGHSLLAAQVLSRLRQKFGVAPPLRALFEAPTIAGIAKRVEALGGGDAAPARPRIEPVPRDRPAPLSFAQQRLWFFAQIEPDSPVYHIPLLRPLANIDVAAFERALATVRQRHESLRTVFASRGGEPCQIVVDEPMAPLPLIDFSGLNATTAHATEQQWFRQLNQRPFDLSRGPLFRASLARMSPGAHALCLIIHHIVADGWSMGVLQREMTALYEAYVQGVEAELPQLPIQYPDYAHWQRRWMSPEAMRRHLDYWRAELGGSLPTLELPTDRPRPRIQRFEGGFIPAALPADLATRLEALGARLGATPFMVHLALYAALLRRYTNQADLVAGTPSANRDLPEIEGLIGFFVNTLAIRIDLSGEPSFLELLTRVRDKALAAFEHGQAPFESVVEAAAPERDLSRNPVFQTLFALQARDEAVAARLMDDADSAAAGDFGASHFDLALNLVPSSRGLAALFQFNGDLFDRQTIVRMARNWRRLAAQAAEWPETPIRGLEGLAAAERDELLTAWNGDDRAYEPLASIIGLFERQAAQRPEAEALRFPVNDGVQRFSYAALEGLANQLACRLRALGVGPETRVGLCLPRSAEQMIAMLAIFKAGGAFLPLEPQHPDKRLAAMLADARPAVVIASSETAVRLPDMAPARLLTVSLENGTWMGDLAQASDHPPHLGLAPDNAAYLLYTSGSTGAPKGVVVSHGAFRNRLQWGQETYALMPGDRFLHASGFGFDIAIWEWLAPLSAGAVSILAPAESLGDPGLLWRLIADEEVTHAHFTPSVLAAMLARSDLAQARSLRQVFCGGERLPAALATQFSTKVDAELHQFYGPTEAAVNAVAGPCRPDDTNAPIPLGTPVANARLYLLEPGGLALTPVSARGEIHLGGAALARGYWGRPDVTAAAFIPDPFATRPGARLYRTGDLGRRRHNGALEFAGRCDRQLKLRGFRIEPGEIERALAAHSSVAEALIQTVGEADQPQLAAYVRLAADAIPNPPEPEALRHFLRERLPEQMVPSFIVLLEAFPLTVNGKIDVNALPAPDRAGEAAGDGHQAPRDAVETAICDDWSTLLGLERIGVHAHFFQLGGHSLLATRAVSRLRERFGIDLPVRTLFEKPTPAHLAEAVRDALRDRGDGAPPPIQPAAFTDRAPVSFAQQRLYFIAQLEPENPAYNMPASLQVDGPFALGLYERALQIMIERHQALRTTFQMADGEPVQAIHQSMPFQTTLIDAGGLPEPVAKQLGRRLIREQALKPFDLFRGPLLRCASIRLSPERRLLAHGMHHIISDGWSTDIFVSELTQIYQGLCAERPVALPPLPIQYSDYAAWQRRWFQGEALAQQMAYWRAQLGGQLPVLPTSFPRGPDQDSRAETLPFELDAEWTARLRAFCAAEQGSLFMAALTALGLTLRQLVGCDDAIVGAPIANRHRAETERVIGFFVNTLVLRVDYAGATNLTEGFRRARRATLDAYAHQDLPFDKLVQELKPARDPRVTPLFQCMLLHRAADAPPAPGASEDHAAARISSLDETPEMILFDLLVSFAETAEGCFGALHFKSALFEPGLMARVKDFFLDALRALARAPRRGLDEDLLFAQGERQRLLLPYRPPRTPSPAVATPATGPAARTARQASGTAPAGYPYPNYACYVVDAQLNPMPFGAPGELCIAGRCLSRGYHDRPDLTAERFLPNPFSRAPGDRMYRTGDRAAYFANGAIDFLGRIDFQIKIRGFRVEPGEIEAALLEHDLVREALVLARGDGPGEKQLAAYIVLTDADAERARTFEQAGGARALRNFLKAALPDYMIPSGFVFLDALPLSPNGKIDRKALPAPEGLAPDDFAPPRDELERRLCAVWEEVLGVRPIGIRNNFFDLGGHSLLSLKLVDRVHKALGVNLPVSVLFQRGTPAAMADAIRGEPLAAESEGAFAEGGPLIPLKRDGDSAPLFLVHAVGGNVMAYRELARALDANRPVYAFEAPGLHGEARPLDSIETMADHYLQAMREVQPHGPYLVGGWSLGGVIALEMARRLEGLGERVARLILLDSMLAICGHAYDDVQTTLSFVFDLAKMDAPRFDIDAATLASLNEDARLAYALSWAKRHGALPPEFDENRARALYAVFKANLQAASRYEPRPCAAPATLFRCEAGPSTSYGWEEAGIQFETIAIPGNHYTTLMRPHARATAEALAARLRNDQI